MNLIQPKYYLAIAKKLYQFTVNPYHVAQEPLSSTQKIQGTWAVFAVKMLLTIILGIASNLLNAPANQTTARHSDTFSPLQLVLVGVLILPFLEEVAFRLSLKFKAEFLAFTSAVLAYYFLSKAIYHTNLSNTEVYFKERVLMSLGVLLVSFMLYSWPVINKALAKSWEKSFRWILYSFCFVFAAMHLFNYDLSNAFLFIPLLLLPKLISAFTYSYIRINYGFVYSLVLHLMWNGLGVSIKLLTGGEGD